MVLLFDLVTENKSIVEWLGIYVLVACTEQYFISAPTKQPPLLE